MRHMVRQLYSAMLQYYNTYNLSTCGPSSLKVNNQIANCQVVVLGPGQFQSRPRKPRDWRETQEHGLWENKTSGTCSTDQMCTGCADRDKENSNGPSCPRKGLRTISDGHHESVRAWCTHEEKIDEIPNTTEKDGSARRTQTAAQREPGMAREESNGDGGKRKPQKNDTLQGGTSIFLFLFYMQSIIQEKKLGLSCAKLRLSFGQLRLDFVSKVNCQPFILIE